MTMICEYCKTEVDVGDIKFRIERTMDMEPPANVVWVQFDDNNKPLWHLPFLHTCHKGKAE